MFVGQMRPKIYAQVYSHPLFIQKLFYPAISISCKKFTVCIDIKNTLRFYAYFKTQLFQSRQYKITPPFEFISACIQFNLRLFL